MQDTAQLNHGREVLAGRQERYTAIAGQLSDDKTAVRLAGIYALSALADEWQEAGDLEQRNTCVKLLCACLRISPSTTDGGDEEVRQAVISMIQAHTLYGRKPSWPGRILDLSNANLKNASLQHCDLSEASFSGADLEGANLSKSNLSHCFFLKSNMSAISGIASDFTMAVMDGARLLKARVVDASFHRAVLTGCDFREAHLSGADLSGAVLNSAILVDATLSLNSPKSCVKLVSVDESGLTPDISVIRWDSKTRWPQGVEVEKEIWHQVVKVGIDPEKMSREMRS